MSGLQKNVASQKLKVFAFDSTTNAPKTGDAANITCKVSKDYAVSAALTDTNPTEAADGGGYYLFDLTQAETNADVLDFFPVSSTGDIVVIPVCSPYTVYASFSDNVAQSQDHTTNVNSAATDAASAATDAASAAADTTQLLIDVAANQTDLNAILATVPTINTALSDIPFVMVLTSDHVTPATGLTVTGEVSHDGGAPVAVTGTISEIGNGEYSFDASAADMNGAKNIFRFSAATADDSFVTIFTKA
jgi:hypothetical protein